MTFCQMVQKGLVAHPPQVKFKVEEWIRAFQKTAEPSYDDLDLFTAGIWFFRKLTAIRTALQAVDITTSLSREKTLRMLVGHVNRTWFIMSKSHINSTGDTFFGEQLIQGKYTNNAYGVEYTPDEILAGSIDGIRFPVRHTLKIKNSKSTAAIVDDEILNKMFNMVNLGNYYSDLEALWLEVLWNGWKIVTTEDKDFVIASERNKVQQVTDYRRQTLLLQEFFFAAASWKKMPMPMKIIAATRPYIEIEGVSKRKHYKITTKTEIEHPPMTFIAEVAANEFYFADVLNVSLGAYNNLTINQLFKIWEMLYSLAERLVETFPISTEVHSVGKICEYAPKVQVKKISQLIQDLLGIENNKANEALRLFIFSGNDEIWFKPLIPIDDEMVFLVIAPIISPNLLRLVEHWMKDGGFPMAERGDLFENHIRTQLAEAIQQNEMLTKFQVIKKTSKIKCIDEQVDLIILAGHKLLIGEVKCGVFPASGMEFSNYCMDLEFAAAQLLRKCSAIKNNIENVVMELGLKFNAASSYHVTPVIVTNQEYYSGFEINGVSVTDLLILSRYLKEGRYNPSGFFSQSGELTTTSTIFFYHSEAEAIENLDAYLSNPPQVENLKSHLKQRFLPHLPIEGHKPCFTRSFEVKLPVPAANYKMAPEL